MSEIKIGEYVRTKAGIGKIVEIFKCDDEEVYYTDTYIDDKNENSDILYEHQILKHSKNIVDLIKVNDMVELEIDKDLTESKDKKFFLRPKNISKKWRNNLKKGIEEEIYKIKAILTKEQYEQNCYKLEE